MSVDTTSPDAALSHVELLEHLEAAYPGRRWEITETGDVHLAMSPSRPHATIARKLEIWLEGFVDDPVRVQNTGHIQTVGYGKREPDVMVFDGRELPPDWATPAEYLRLVIEINSPSNPDDDWRLKMIAYAQAGIPHYWIVSEGGMVAMHRLGHGGYVHIETVALDWLLDQDHLPEGVEL